MKAPRSLPASAMLFTVPAFEVAWTDHLGPLLMSFSGSSLLNLCLSKPVRQTAFNQLIAAAPLSQFRQGEAFQVAENLVAAFDQGSDALVGPSFETFSLRAAEPDPAANHLPL